MKQVSEWSIKKYYPYERVKCLSLKHNACKPEIYFLFTIVWTHCLRIAMTYVSCNVLDTSLLFRSAVDKNTTGTKCTIARPDIHCKAWYSYTLLQRCLFEAGVIIHLKDERVNILVNLKPFIFAR